ncbi:MAG: TetR/AcrR family transcriptional regulator [Bacteroidia bacterium]|nr:TetR/AcrR family transcriptional regulator [Bacteroidia bacterium]
MGTQANIRSAALHLFATQGFAGVTMRKVAQEVGVSAPALYRHYPSKDHLLWDLVKSGFDTFYQYELRALQGKTPWERLVLLNEEYFRFATEHADYYRVMFLMEWQPDDPAIHEAMGNHAWITFQFLVDRMRELIDAGLFRPGVPESLAFTIWSQVHGSVSLMYCGVMEMKGVNSAWQYREGWMATVTGLATEKLLADIQRLIPSR